MYKYLSVLVFSILLTFTAIIVLLLLPFAYMRIRIVVKIIIQFWAKSIFLLMGKQLKVYGRENIVKSKKYIIIANHGSLFDIPAIMSICPSVAWFGHSRLMRIPVFKQILKMINYIPLQYKNISNTRTMLKGIIEISRHNTLAIFPEGTRTLDGEMKDFFRGFVYALRSSGSDVLPVTLNGFFRLKPKNRSWIDFNAPISLTIHPAITSKELKSKSDQEILDEMKNVIQDSLTLIKNENISYD